MIKTRRAGIVVALVLVFAATWLVLDRTERRPGWLAVEAPQVAFIGGSFEIRVTLKDAVRATRIVCTLHRAGTDRRIRGYLASSGPARDVARGGTYAFVFAIPEREDMAFVSAIIFLSPTGRWEDGTRAASTKLAPVSREPAPGPSQVLKKTRVYHYLTAAEQAAAAAFEKRPRSKPSAWVHPIFFCMLLASAALCLAKAGRKRPDEGPEETRTRKIWLLFSAVLALSAILELSSLAGHLAAWGRRMAEALNLYDLRKTYQEAIMSAVAAGGLGLFFLFIKAMKRPGHPRLMWLAGIGLAGYLAISFVGVLSFHAVDVVRGMTWHGISPFDAARGAGAGVVLLAALLALKSGKGAAG